MTENMYCKILYLNYLKEELLTVLQGALNRFWKTSMKEIFKFMQMEIILPVFSQFKWRKRLEGYKRPKIYQKYHCHNCLVKNVKNSWKCY